MASEYAARAVQSLFDYFRSDLPSELRRVETAAGLGAGYLPDPIHYFGVHPHTPSPVVALYYVDDEGMVPMSSGQRLRKWSVNCNVEIRLRGASPNPVASDYQGNEGAFMQADYHRLYHYASALVGMLEPRAGSAIRVTLDGRVNAALVQRVVFAPLSQLPTNQTNVGLTMVVKVDITQPSSV